MMKREITPGQRTMATILEFPERFARGAVLREHITAMQGMAEDTPHPVIEIILSLLEQVHRTNAAIAAYQTELKASNQERQPVTTR